MRVLLIVAASVAAAWPTLGALHARWTDWDAATYTHGYLVLAISVILLWRANVGREIPTPAVRDRTRPLAMVLLVGTCLVWVLAVRAGIVAAEWLLLPLLPLLAIWAAFGAATAQRNLFPIGFFCFAVPLWSIANGLFQGATVFAVRGLLRTVGIPSHFNGNFVQIPAGTFEIAGGCSGLHFVIVALALAALMGEMRDDDWRGRFKLLLLAGALAVFTNWIRVFTIILAGHYTNMQHYLVARSHYNYGWVLFAVAMVVFFLLERRMAVRATARDDSTAAVPPRVGGLVRPVLATALVLGAMAVLQVLSSRPAQAQLSAAEAVPPWSAVEEATRWEPVIQGADLSARQIFRTVDGPAIERRQYLFKMQRQAKELGGYENDVTGGQTILSSQVAQIAARPVAILETRDAQGDLWVVAAAYETGGRYFASPAPAQLSYALRSVAGLRSRPASIFLWRTACVPDCQAAVERVGHFVEMMEPEDRPQ